MKAILSMELHSGDLPRILLFPLFKNLFSPLHSVQGPIAARFTDLWYLWRVRQGEFERVNIDLHRKYGDVVRYGPNRYSVSSTAAQKAIYGHGAKFPKSSWYATWQNPPPKQWSLFADQSMARHSENRRQYQSMYSMSSLVSYEPYVDECADLFSQRLQEVASAGAYTDMGHWLQCYAFDVIGLITYLKRLGFLDRGEDIKGVIAALEDHLWYATSVGIFSWLHKYLFPIRNWLAGPAGTGRAYVMKFTQERIADHQKEQTKGIPVDGAEEGKTSMDFLTKFFRKNADDPKAFTMYHIVSGCVSNMVAGSDTTAISLSAILYYLLKNPDSFQKLRREIDDRKTSHFITFKESQEMPYLQAVIKEALRMHSVVGLPLERVVPAGGATICERFFPEGTIVGINSWVAHSDTSVFGTDAHRFRPERWLSSNKETLSLMERSWMPFGLGSRTCIGRHISLLEMSKLIPALIRDFDFTLDSHLQVDEWQTTNYWFVKPRNFRVKIAVRHQ
ncbi:cytochrome p450 oxidoreductase [Pyrenophora seminiperda CCB06]|uniref:Cytochrome p450 oxidoreductase n=1 Tax=Pyrenophora seminiperda CCB06 TaxID=1302712 RepID=A0A3M7LYQ7_9PLEO|nr:cytochrome p450 oxidoreductase [Pyrenophora seminiperda CCB06]